MNFFTDCSSSYYPLSLYLRSDQPSMQVHRALCKCIEHCATARAYSKFRENGVLVKMDDVEAGIQKSNKEKENVKETIS